GRVAAGRQGDQRSRIADCPGIENAYVGRVFQPARASIRQIPSRRRSRVHILNILREGRKSGTQQTNWDFGRLSRRYPQGSMTNVGHSSGFLFEEWIMIPAMTMLMAVLAGP